MSDDAQMVTDCEARQEKLSNWELDFIQSISDELGAGRALTGNQRAKLEQIWERVT